MKAIETLMQKKGRFDYIILETTGLADPGEMPMQVKIQLRYDAFTTQTGVEMWYM